MADPTVNGVLEMTDAHVLGPDTLIVDGTGIQEPENDVTDEDILQQALDEASGTLVTGPYSTGDENVAEHLVGSVASGTFVDGSDANGVTSEVTFDGATYAVVNSDNVVFTTGDTAPGTEIEHTIQDPDSSLTMRMEVDDDSVNNMLNSDETGTLIGDMNQNNTNSISAGTEITTAGGIRVRLVPVNEGSGAPLGSSQNPIRIIQQGNQYTPVQHLTTEQLQQIMQVVQEQQVAKSTTQEGSSILYNQQTNTRIVYRVIYPSELHKTSNSSNVSVQSQGQQTVILSQGRRPYKKRKADEDDKVDGPDLSKEEKEIRKKHRPRTRSGRISKPPKHMVKDYKHIHVLDFDEDYDDSDGGYSDFKYSEDEREREEAESLEANATGDEPGVSFIGRPKRWKCETCNKCYIGRGGLSRHYRIYPDHGNIEDIAEETEGTQRNVQNGVNNTGSMSEDSNTQDSLTGVPPVIRPRRGAYRGRNSFHHEHAMRRRSKLKELIRQCGDEDLMDIVLPRLAKVLTLWEFLLMKVEKGVPIKPQVDDVYREFEALSKHVQKVCKSFLKPLDGPVENSSMNTLQMENEKLADLIGLNTGTYEVLDPPESELSSTFQYTRRIPKEYISHASPGRPRIKRSENNPFISQIPQEKKLNTTSVKFVTAQPSNPVTSIVTGPSKVSNSNNSLGKIESVVQTNTVTLPIMTSLSTNLNSQTSMPTVVRQQPTSTPVIIQTLGTKTQTKSSAMSSILPSDLKSLGSAQKPKPVASTSDTVTFFTPSVTSSIITNSMTSHKMSSAPPIQVLIAPDNVQTPVATSVPQSLVSSFDSEILPQDSNDVTFTSEQSENGVISNNLKTQESEILLQNITASDDLEKSLNSVMSKVDDGTSLDIIDTGGGGESSDIQHTEMVQLVGNEILGEEDQVEGIQVASDHIISASNIYQTTDGIIIIQNQDGSTVQLQGGDGEPIPLETLQALLAMDSDGQLLQTTMEGEEIDQ